MSPLPRLLPLRLASAASVVALTALFAPAGLPAPAAHAAPAAPSVPARTAAATSWYLNITGQAQEQTNWCWAATGNSVADYYGYGQYSQNQFCNMAFGRAIDSTCPNNQATLANDQTAFRTIGFVNPGTYVSGQVSFSTVVNQVSGNRPVMTRIGWASGGGHMMVITGYDQSKSTIQYYDPWPSDPRMNTSTFAWYQSNSTFTWTHSLYGMGV